MRWLPPALIVVAIALDQATPASYFFGSLLTASVVLAIFAYSPLGVAATGAVGCVLLALTEQVEYEIGPQTVTTLIVLSAVTALSVALCLVRVRFEGRFQRVRAVAEAVQLALLRPLPAHLGPVRLAGFYRAADHEALIGGDLYSLRRTPFGVRVVVGDVKGKGIETTQTVATVLSTFREAALTQPTLPQLADRIDTALQLDRDTAELETGGDGVRPGPVPWDEPEQNVTLADELFTTAVLLQVSPAAQEVLTLDRGHQPLLLLRSCHLSVMETEHSLPLGIGDLLTDPPSVVTHSVEPGDILIAYSDGITEARNRQGDFYPLHTRLQAFCDRSPQPLSPPGIIDFLESDLARWAPDVTDDVVALALQIAPPDSGT